MAGKPVQVELFFSAGCGKCAQARATLREAAEAAGPIEWREVDIAQHPHRAVDLGVVSTPALAISGELVFPSMPAVDELRKAIQKSLGT